MIKFYTIGHSTRKIEDFISILKTHRIELLVDVRAFPVSTRNPQFNQDNLESSLIKDGIEYTWSGKVLGGYRKKSDSLGEKSPNKGWETEGFRIYADYMMSDSFKKATAQLMERAKEKTVACMCAEKFYWRCHRRLISDYLVSLGHEVWHIMEPDSLRKHELTKFAKVKEGVLSYPAEDSAEPSLFKT
ncbi:MAG: DUF488 family protein [Candidatus Aminicenantes bacterium]|nr:DUF488 family protein [Candidatus Aminicenantes bacterium]